MKTETPQDNIASGSHASELNADAPSMDSPCAHNDRPKKEGAEAGVARHVAFITEAAWKRAFLSKTLTGSTIRTPVSTDDEKITGKA